MRKYNVNDRVLLDETATSFYLLGLYMTDGCISGQHNNNFIIALKDKELIVKIRDLMCPHKPIYKNRLCADLRMNSFGCVNWLQSYGCVMNKSLTLELTKGIPKEFLVDFLRGCIDGDGSISIKYNRVYLCSASKVFIEQISNLIGSRFHHKISTIEYFRNQKRGTQYRINIFHYSAQDFLKWIYYPSHELSMQRKLKSANELIKKQYTYKHRSLKECENVMSLHMAGMINTEIASKTGLPRGTIWNIINRSHPIR